MKTQAELREYLENDWGLDLVKVPSKTDNTHISPSGRWELTIETYKPPRGWNITKGIVREIATNEIKFTIVRDYMRFPFCFFEKDGIEWLCCGKHYESQTFINLDENMIYDNTDESRICWDKMKVNKSGTILSTQACVWGGPTEIMFYDITDPSKGWDIIPTDHSLSAHEQCDDSTQEVCEWVGDTCIYRYYVEMDKKYDKPSDELSMEELDDLIKDEKAGIVDNYYCVPIIIIHLEKHDDKMKIVKKEIDHEFIRKYNIKVRLLDEI